MSNSKLVVLIFQEQDDDDEIKGLHGAPIEKNVKETLGWSNWETIKKDAKNANVKLRDAAIVYKTRDGRMELQQTMDITSATGAKRGSFWGLLIGLVLGGPLAGALWGLALGAVYGNVADKGIDDQFIKDVTQTMKPRSSAIFILLEETDYEHARPYLQSFEAEIFESTLSATTEEAVNKALENEEVAKAVEAQMG